MENIFIRQGQLLKLLGVSNSKLIEWERAGTFPRRKQLSPQSMVWLVLEIEAWVKALPEPVMFENGASNGEFYP